MSGLQAARMGDMVGSHTSALFGLFAGLITGLVVGLVLGALVIGSVLSGGALLAIVGASLVAIGGTISLAAIGAKIGKKFGSTFKGTGTPCSGIMLGSLDTNIENQKAARAEIDPSGPCAITKMPPTPLAQGSSLVFVNEKMLARDTDTAKCGGKIIMHCLNVWVGGPAGGTPGSEVPEWASDQNLDRWAMIGGGIALLGSVMAFGAVATVVMGGMGFVAGQAGKYIGMGAGRLADWMGGRTDKRWEDFGAGVGEVGFGLAAGFGRFGKWQMRVSGRASEWVGSVRGGAFNRQGIVRGFDNPQLRAMTSNLPKAAQNRLLSDAARSPSLRESLLKLKGENWTINHDPNYAGAYADRDNKVIMLGGGDHYTGTGVAAHEIGHANFELPPHEFDPAMTRQEYVDRNAQRHFTDEGEADFMRLRTRDEILESGGRDTAGSDGTRGQQHYEDYKAGRITREEAVRRMGDDISGLVQSGPSGRTYRQEYAEHYGKAWDKWNANAPTLPPPAPGASGGGGGKSKLGEGASEGCATCGSAAEVPKASAVRPAAPKEEISAADVARGKEWLAAKKAAGRPKLAEDAAALKALEARNAATYKRIKAGEVNHTETTAERLKLAVEGDVDGQRVPLTFKDRAQFDRFQADVREAFESEGIYDAEVVQIGSATTGYKGNPDKYAKYIEAGGTPEGWADGTVVTDAKGKPLKGTWDDSSDTDLAIFSDQAMVQSANKDAAYNDHYGFISTSKPGRVGFEDTPVGAKLQGVSEKWNQEIYGTKNPDNGGFEFKLNTDPNTFNDAPAIYQGPRNGGGP